MRICAMILRPTAARLLCSVLLLISLLPPGATAVWLNLPASGTKCVSEEIQPHVVVLADYAVISEDHTRGIPTLSVKVTSPYGNTLHHQENATVGQVAFTTTEAGNYLACFWMMVAKEIRSCCEAIHENLLYLKAREAEMRVVSERTNARVAWFSICPCVCIGVSGLQLWHLKRFFQKKKLI
ncbi:transmembrane emp24 domain-containing protein p24delta3-like [Phoenix dactylifera]|uniref:Transmembrane emp24 domain-containing protein p24delta3-like n=1 Tax=Phoenix dactylifera TaxID=42345 RepID=A0A8B9AV95_PHODC|nr:transmembrane emp24 domain-containing protein p24delta3-like [Phoenix dactylifera]